MTKKTSREIAITWIEANKNNKGVDVAGNKKWVGVDDIIAELKEISHRLHHDSIVTCWEELVDDLIEKLDEED